MEYTKEYMETLQKCMQASKQDRLALREEIDEVINEENRDSVVAKRLENANKYQQLQDENDSLVEQINVNECQISNLIQANENLTKEKNVISSEVETILGQMEEFKD